MSVHKVWILEDLGLTCSNVSCNVTLLLGAIVLIGMKYEL